MRTKLKNLRDNKVLAVDPGKDTGLAMWFPIANKFNAWQHQWNHFDFFSALQACHPSIIVCESFVHIQKSGIDYTPVEMIAIVKFYKEYRFTIDDPVELYWQTPAYGKGYFDNDKLKKLGLFVPGKDHEDAMDALRHLLQFFMANDAFDLELLK